VRIKTFYGDRNTYRVSVNISEKIFDLIPKICIEEDKTSVDDKKKWNYANQFRLVSTSGYLHEVNPLKTFVEEEIKENQLLILLASLDVCFNEFTKGPSVLLESRNKVANKLGADEHQFAMSSLGYSSGKHYCEFLLETEPYEKSVIIGVSLKRVDFYLNPNDSKGLYAFVLSECKKMSSNSSNKVEMVEYGDITKMGDRVGILMEFHSTGLDVSFFINKINMGVAFKNIPLNTYYPSVVLGYDGTRVRITNKVRFPDI
jgi:hypothetical protein